MAKLNMKRIHKPRIDNGINMETGECVQGCCAGDTSGARPQKTAKRIHKVVIKHLLDESPDTSYLGEYGDRATSYFSIDRAHSTDCAINCKPTSAIDQLERAISYLAQQDRDNGTDFDYNRDAIDELIALQDALAECDCGESGTMGRNEFRYFNPSFNYVDKDGRALAEITPDEIRDYVKQDYARMESLNAGDWHYIGIRAEAEIQLTKDGPLQEITSGGLWGIESDSDRDYLGSIAKEELSDLSTQLQALGFSKRAIASAFKNVTEVPNE